MRFMKTKSLLALLLSFCLSFALASCGSSGGGSKTEKVGGLAVTGTEKMQVLRGKEATWVVDGKWKVEILGVYLIEDEVLDTLYAKGSRDKVLFSPSNILDIDFRITNIGHNLTNEEIKNDKVNGTQIFKSMRINKGDVAKLRPYPFTEEDRNYDTVTLNYGFPAIETGGESDILTLTMASDRRIQAGKDVLVFYCFVPSGEVGGNPAWFEMEIQENS